LCGFEQETRFRGSGVRENSAGDGGACAERISRLSIGESGERMRPA